MVILLLLFILIEVEEFPFPVVDSQHRFPTYIRFLLHRTEFYELKRDMNKSATLWDAI